MNKKDERKNYQRKMMIEKMLKGKEKQKRGLEKHR